ncbi:hypothetical protein [Nesterenkonia aerolata]|uniref:DUF3311 domain-containing protein n=1 Tax=Nesterenkonia aerolata TaxID=3074079 RepID=A0ABU2DPX5_9MICC|nr:hypothetical protein [Nesterenkonia sp. LY-0111]MDR8018446.1 hypothetical protein [Nesterenkonia sp. LY-0111]
MTHRKSSSRLATSLIATAGAVILLPPLHWLFGNGHLGWSLGYMIGSTVVVTVIIYILNVVIPAGEE